LEAPRIERYERGERERERDPGAAAEREVEGRAQDR
jgi:hypothetical protein